MKNSDPKSIAGNGKGELCKTLKLQILVITLILVLIAAGFLAPDARCAENGTMLIDLNAVNLTIYPGRGHVLVGGRFLGGNHPIHSWEVVQLAEGLVHIRHKSWKAHFWKIDTAQKKIWRIKGTDLHTTVLDALPLNNIVVDVNEKKFVDTPKAITTITLSLLSPQLVLDQQNAVARIVAEETVVSAEDEWEVRCLSVELCQFRFKIRQASFWQVNKSDMKVSEISNGNFGFLGGSPFDIHAEVHLFGKEDTTVKGGVPVDLGMAKYQGSPPKSTWLESEKALNEALLEQHCYDVLVVPFQVGGYAIDRPDRSLMTRYLAQAIEESTTLKLPSTTLVMRALGEAARTFDEYAIFQLANKLGVKQIIRGYVGHNLDEKMNITLVVQTRTEQEYFSPATKKQTYEWGGLAIADDRTPADVFLDVLPEVLGKIRYQQTKKQPMPVIFHDARLPLPADVQGFVLNNASSLVTRAYYLQLLGILHPEESAMKEMLFERSLVVLRESPSQSSAYRLLKARALFYLHRRPAAVAVLSSPKKAEEKALAAFMDGNTKLLEKAVKEIKEPLLRLIAQLELADLRWSYEPNTARESIDATVKQYPGWEMILTRRLQQRDAWTVQSNLDVKKELDRLFPIGGFAAKDILKNKIVIGELSIDDERIDLSVYDHYRRLMERWTESLAKSESAQIVERDLLDLMVAFGESNLLKKIRLRRTQALYDDLIALIERYGSIYRGHPEMSLQKALALYRTADAQKGRQAENLRQEASQIQQDVCFWSQGQTSIAAESCSSSAFDSDYPRRWYWGFSNDPEAKADRNYKGPRVFPQMGPGKSMLMVTPFDFKQIMNLDLSLQYAQTDFSRFSSYYEKLLRCNMIQEAAALMEKNQQRFEGNAQRTTFFAELAWRKGDIKRAKLLYEKDIASQKKSWTPYRNLSLLLIRQGEFMAALDTALKYPLFAEARDREKSANIDTVALSNQAFHIGYALWQCGASDKASLLFKLSAGYDTGSASEMGSMMLLSILDQDYQKAAQAALTSAKRYNSIGDYSDYMKLLHAMGYHDEAWSAFNQIQGDPQETMDWSPILLGHRMGGKTIDEQIQWLLKYPVNTFSSQDITEYAFYVHVLDRKPEVNLSVQLKELRDRVESTKEQAQSPVYQKSKRESPGASQLKTAINVITNKRGEPIEVLADSYVLLKQRSFAEAYEKLKVRFLDEWIRKDMFSFPTTYLAMSASKSGLTAEVGSYLAKYKNELGVDFDYYLSEAFLLAGKKEHKDAIRNLNSARSHVQYANGMRLLPAWYQLAEACEWLYEDSKYEGYRDQLLEYVKLYQKTNPMDAWAYAFEAKYSRSDADRKQALALTLYLDRLSARISEFSSEDKGRALDWLKANNPFLSMPNKSRENEV